MTVVAGLDEGKQLERDAVNVDVLGLAEVLVRRPAKAPADHLFA